MARYGLVVVLALAGSVLLGTYIAGRDAHRGKEGSPPEQLTGAARLLANAGYGHLEHPVVVVSYFDGAPHPSGRVIDAATAEDERVDVLLALYEGSVGDRPRG